MFVKRRKSGTFDGVDVKLLKNHKLSTVVSYSILVVGLSSLKIALFVSDIYTCIKLLAFNTWSNNIIQPYIPFRITKWLFSACILTSVVLILLDSYRCYKVVRTKNIAYNYMNSMARNYQSLTSFAIFCVFNKITPKGRLQRMAFFVYFELKHGIKLLLTDTPRQVINGLTLWSILIAVNGKTDNPKDLRKVETLHGLFSKIRQIAITNHEEAVLLSFMLFSFIVWTFFFLKLLLAMICSMFVYQKLLKRYKLKGGLKEFVIVSISDKIDDLVESSTNNVESYDFSDNEATYYEILDHYYTADSKMEKHIYSLDDESSTLFDHVLTPLRAYHK